MSQLILLKVYCTYAKKYLITGNNIPSSCAVDLSRLSIEDFPLLSTAHSVDDEVVPVGHMTRISIPLIDCAVDENNDQKEQKNVEKMIFTFTDKGFSGSDLYMKSM